MEENKNKIGNVITIVGVMGSGKSPIAKKIAEQSKIENLIVLNDVHHEYDELKYSTFYDIDIFKELLPRMKASSIIIEEATTFVNSYRDNDLIRAIAYNQHNNNILIFLFHGLRFLPPYLKDLCNYIILAQNYSNEDEPKKIDIEQVKDYIPEHLDQVEKEIDLHTDIWMKHR